MMGGCCCCCEWNEKERPQYNKEAVLPNFLFAALRLLTQSAKTQRPNCLQAQGEITCSLLVKFLWLLDILSQLLHTPTMAAGAKRNHTHTTKDFFAENVD
jgi:hypothetical protein